jgi:hypothetical protein
MMTWLVCDLCERVAGEVYDSVVVVAPAAAVFVTYHKSRSIRKKHDVSILRSSCVSVVVVHFSYVVKEVRDILTRDGHHWCSNNRSGIVSPTKTYDSVTTV